MLKYDDLRSYQLAISDFIASHQRCNIFAGMGVGKTCSALTALDSLHLIGLHVPTLIIAPLRVARITWPGEAGLWEHLRGIDVVPVVGTPDERVRALRRNAFAHAINFENIPWLVEHYGDRWPFKRVVFDEASKLRGFRLRQGSARAGALRRLAHTKIESWVNLTGTPTPNGLENLWGINWFVDKGKRLGLSYEAFKERWFELVLPHPKSKFPVLQPRPFAKAQIEAALSDVTFTLEARDFMQLPPLVENTVGVDLPRSARKHYREMEAKFYTEIGATGIEAISAAAKSMKLLQLASGVAYHDDGVTWSEVHCEKLDALGEIIDEANGAPVLVAYHFKSDLARILKRFPQAVPIGKDPDTVKRWNAGEIPVLLAHPESAGHGLSLQHGGNILAFFTSNWNLESDAQIIERIGPTRQAQSGYDRPVFVHRIVARGTVDELVLDRLRTKASLQDLFMAAMKKHNATR